MSRAHMRPYKWKHRYLITNEDGTFAVDIAVEHTAKNADTAIKILMSEGLRVVESREARRHLAKFLQIRPDTLIIRTSRAGWLKYPGSECWVFVLPDEVLGATKDMHIVLDGESPSGSYGFNRLGTSEQWREYVARPLAGNSNVVLAVGTLLAAPLLRWANEPGGGFHFYGFSKAGKTLIIVIGQSVWGKPYIPGSGDSDAFGHDWNSTAARLAERAVPHSSVGMSLEGLEGSVPKAVGPAIYMLTGGGRGRMRQREAAYNLTLLSTGEISVAEFLGDDVREGQKVRLSDVPVEVQPGSGFEQFRPDAAGKQFYPATSEYYGTVGHEWLQYLVDQTPERFVPRLNELRNAFLAQPVVVEIFRQAHSQVITVINRFALVAAALAMAIGAKILPWSQTDTDTCCVACMKRWLNQRGNIDASGERLREIERRRRTFAATANDRLIRLDKVGGQIVAATPADQHKLDRVEEKLPKRGEARFSAKAWFEAMEAEHFDGYVRNGLSQLIPAAWERLWAGLEVEGVTKHLLNRQLLVPGRGGKVSSPQRYKNGAPATRFYILTLAFIDHV